MIGTKISPIGAVLTKFHFCLKTKLGLNRDVRVISVCVKSMSRKVFFSLKVFVLGL